MVAMLPIDINPNTTTTLFFPIFNVIVVSTRLPGKSDRRVLYSTKDLSFSIAYVIAAKVSFSDHFLLYPAYVYNCYHYVNKASFTMLVMVRLESPRTENHL